MIRLHGHDYSDKSKELSFIVNACAINFQTTDYTGQVKAYRTELDTADPYYATGKDNSGKAYETVTWVGAYLPKYDKCLQVELQTWDRHTVYLWALWPHYRDGYYPGASKTMASQSSIIDLDQASAVKLAALLEALKHPQEVLL